MRRRLIMGLLAVGVVAGYGSGFAHLRACHWQHEQYRQHMMNEFAQHCVDATRTAPPAAQTAGAAQVVQPAQPGGAVTVVVNPAR